MDGRGLVKPALKIVGVKHSNTGKKAFRLFLTCPFRSPGPPPRRGKHEDGFRRRDARGVVLSLLIVVFCLAL
jgi:hypothetical protein